MSSAGAEDPARAARGRQHHPQWMPQKTKQQTPAAGGARSRDGSSSHRSQSRRRSGSWSWSRCCSAFVACASGCTQWQTVASVNCSTKLCSISCTSSQSCQLLNQPPPPPPPISHAPLPAAVAVCALQMQQLSEICIL